MRLSWSPNKKRTVGIRLEVFSEDIDALVKIDSEEVSVGSSQ